MKIAVAHGPNLNRLEQRDPARYGADTLAEIDALLHTAARAAGISLITFQSNSEGAIIDWIQEQADTVDAFIVNPAGLTLYGRSLRDCLRDTGRPVAVVHLSAWFSYEPPGTVDIFSGIASIYIAGARSSGYLHAMTALAELHGTRSES